MNDRVIAISTAAPDWWAVYATQDGEIYRLPVACWVAAEYPAGNGLRGGYAIDAYTMDGDGRCSIAGEDEGWLGFEYPGHKIDAEELTRAAAEYADECLERRKRREASKG